MFTSLDSAAWKEHLKDFAHDRQHQQLAQTIQVSSLGSEDTIKLFLTNLWRRRLHVDVHATVGNPESPTMLDPKCSA